MNRKTSQTCIALLKNKNGKIVMAADRRSSFGYTSYQRMPVPKISEINGVLRGATGNGYICTLFVDELKLPDLPVKCTKQNINTYVHETVYHQLKELFLDKGFVDRHNKDLLAFPLTCEAELLLVVRGHLYSITIDHEDTNDNSPIGILQIDEMNVPYATGCGGELAWGSLLTSEKITGLSTKDRLKLAIDVASQVSWGCDSYCDFVSE